MNVSGRNTEQVSLLPRGTSTGGNAGRLTAVEGDSRADRRNRGGVLMHGYQARQHETPGAVDRSFRRAPRERGGLAS